MAERIYVFKRFERFWHWSQAGLIMFLMLTAFDIHGTYTIFGFEKAVSIRNMIRPACDQCQKRSNPLKM